MIKKLIKATKYFLKSLTLDYEVAILTCIEKGVPLTKENIFGEIERTNKLNSKKNHY